MSASQQKKLRQQLREQGVEKRQIAQKEAQQQAKKSKTISTVVWTVVVIALIAAILFSSNLFYHAFSAVKIGDTGYNASELSFFYKSGYFNFVSTNQDYLQYLGLDTTQPLSSQAYGEDGTWADFFMDSAVASATEVTAMYDAAKAAGFELSEEDKAAFESEFVTLAETAESAGVSVNAYLAASYGKGVNEKLVRNLLEKTYIAQAYEEQMYNSYTYTDSELDTYYEENKDKYDRFTYISYFANGAENTEEGIDKETAMANAEELANSVIEGVTTEEQFSQSVLAKTQSEASSVTTQGSGLSASYSEWMTDAARKAGDMTVIESDTGYYALYFISREKNDGRTVSARHILTYALPDENGEYTDEAKAEAKAKAEDLLAQWQAGDATEESFAALANANSADTGSNQNGGLYENFQEGQMVPEFDAWCFDSARKSGDTGIVFNEGQYCGYHVIYFVGEGKTYDKVLTEQDLRGADFNEWKATATEGYTAETSFAAALVK